MKLSPTNYLVSFFSLAILVITFLGFVPTLTLAQEATSSSDLNGQSVNSSNYKAPQNADYALTNFMHGALCAIGGVSPVGQCVTNERQEDGSVQLKAYNRIPGDGALGGIGHAIASLYNQPTSSTEYLASVGKNIGIVKYAYAQSNVEGSGEGIIRPIKDLYLFIQKIAYILFTLIFVIVGFMIMFRRKMNQQTVVNIQNAIPKLVVGLLLITFSYFISALIVDMSFLGVQIIAQVFISSNIPNVYGNSEGINSFAKNSNLLHLFGGAAGQGLKDGFTSLLPSAFNTLSSFFTGGAVGDAAATGVIATPIIAGVIALLVPAFSNPVGWGLIGVGGVIVLIVPLILVIALVIQFFKLFYALINAYISILVATLFSPLIILYASIPGQGGKMDLWWKTLLANSLIFPSVFAGFLFTGMILGGPRWDTNSPPLFGGLSPELLKLLVGYGILLGLPAIPKMIKDALGVKDIQGIPQIASAGLAAGVGGARLIYKKSTDRYRKPIEAYKEARIKQTAQDQVTTGGTPPKWGWRWFLGG